MDICEALDEAIEGLCGREMEIEIPLREIGDVGDR